MLGLVARTASTKFAARSGRIFLPNVRYLSTHETWRDDHDTDNLPKVKKRDGTIGEIDKLRGFVDYYRDPEPYRDPMERVFDWKEINFEELQQSDVEKTVQAARCMDCGTPFCQTHTGCPINNLIPEWNELVYKKQWREAIERLHKTNNFPEFTGRVCPAPCEGACVAGLVDSPVTIKNIEYAIVDYAWENHFITPRVPKYRTGMSVAVIGSGPAGLAAADCLNQYGHKVTVYEREDRVGGLLMYGIPNMKLDKDKVQRRVDMLADEGIEFVTNANIGDNIDARDVKANHDALILSVGATMPRDLDVPGRDLDGIHFAMEFLTKNQKRLMMTQSGQFQSGWDKNSFISAEGKNVIVIGGGDTGTDCIGTSVRQRCQSITNFEIMPRPPDERAPNNPWPQWPRVFGVDYGHAEVMAVFGKDPREYSVTVMEFKGENGVVKSLITQQTRLNEDGKIEAVPGTDKEWPADMVILSMGFVAPEKSIHQQLELNLDQRNNIFAEYGDYRTNVDGVFSAGDCRRGQSLVVWAINEGRGVADACNNYLQHKASMDENAEIFVL